MRFGNSFIQACAASSGRLGASPARLTTYCLGAVVFLTSILYLGRLSSRDPGSLFFSPNTAYTPQYSAIRQRQAERFIVSAATAPPFKSHGDQATLCVGIPSIARKGARYLRGTVGSLLAGLTQEERDRIRLTVFISHTEPTEHPAYSEPWLSNLADQVLLYNLSKDGIDHIAWLEQNPNREKGLFDYTYLLKACYDSETPYIAILEDDVIAVDGWYHRTVAGIRQAETARAPGKVPGDFLYLRLFFTEEYLGWNSENWRTYTIWSISGVLASALLVYVIRSASPSSKHILTPYLSFGICLGAVPLAILCVFAIGRVTVFPLRTGINEMNNYGCCAQGLVFPHSKVPPVVEWLKSSHIGFADMLIEQYADEHREQRWALAPSVLQHVGAQSSKGNDYANGAKHAKAVSENIWNFGFELNDATRLRKEHELAELEDLV